MIALDTRYQAPLYLLIVLGGAVAGSYFVVARDMHLVMQGALMVLAFLICFFSVRMSLILLAFSMLLSPELAVGATAKRAITIRFDDILLFTMSLGWMVRMAILKENIGFMLKNPLNRPMVVYATVACISTGLGIWRGNVETLAGVFFTLKYLEYFFLFNIVVNYVQSSKDVDNLLAMLILVFGIVCMYGLFQAVNGGDVAAPFEGSSGERNTLGGYLVLMGAVAAGVALYSENASERRILAIILPIAAAVLLFSVSRSGWVSAAVATLVLFVTARKKNVILIVICLAFVMIPLVLPNVAADRLDFTFHQIARPDQQFELFGFKFDTSSSARIFSAQFVLKRFMEHPFLGFGVTGFYFVDGQFFRTLSEMGIFGLSTLIWLLYSVHKLVRGAMRAELPPRLHGMVTGFYAGFWALMVHAVTANTFVIVRIAEPFWCLAGLSVMVTMYAKETSGEMAISGVQTGYQERYA